jgi:hypothetical protein
MSSNEADPAWRTQDAAESVAGRRPPGWASDNAYPPGRDAIQRLAERRIAEKRRAKRRKAFSQTGQSQD